MGTNETQIVIMLLPLIRRLLLGDTDTSKLEEKLAEAKTDDAVRDVVFEAAMEEIGDTGAAGTVITDIIKADNTAEVVKVITRPGVIEAFFGAIGGLLSAIFGKK